MALVNTYNYSKPKTFIRADILSENTQKNNQLAGNRSQQQRSPISDKADQYLEARVMTAKPEELTFMLYEGMVKFIKKAIVSLETKDFEKVNYFAKRAQDILSELRTTLDMNVPMSKDLDSLYEYTEFKLFEANMSKNKDGFNQALEMAESFKSTWQQAFGLV